MSFIQIADLAEIEKCFGKPLEFTTIISMLPFEMDIVRGSQKEGRAHDVTMFIYNDKRFLFIAKHFYPKGLFRAPSGGVKPGETIEAGAKREAYEETGVKIELERYLARIEVRFFNRENVDDYIDWTSYVFKARYISGKVEPQDTDEIREAKYIKTDDITTFNKIMKNSERGGFHYRAFLTETVMALLDKESD